MVGASPLAASGFEHVKDEGKQRIRAGIFALWRRLALPARLRRTLIGTSHYAVLIPSWCWQETEKQEGGQIRTAWRQLRDSPDCLSLPVPPFFWSLLIGLKQNEC